MRLIRFQMLGLSLGGRYRLNRVLAEGPSRVTYEADDAVLRRVVAIKVPIIARGTTLWAREKILRAAAVAAQLPAHQNLVPVLDGGTDSSLDTEYVVMERLYGRTVTSLVASKAPRAPFSVGETVGIGVGIANGLAAAHTWGVAHGSFTADDVFLDQRTSPATVRLLNVARPMGEPTELALDQAGGTTDDVALVDFRAAATLIGELLAMPRMKAVSAVEEEISARVSQAVARVADGEWAPREFTEDLVGALARLRRAAAPARERVTVPSVFGARHRELAGR